MNTKIEMPLDVVEMIADVRFSPKIDARLQHLMTRNTEGTLTEDEREELEALVEWSQQISLLRSYALLALGRKP